MDKPCFYLALCSTHPAIPASLAAAVKDIALWLESRSRETAYHAVHRAAVQDPQLAVALQQVYCEGSLFKRFCSPDAVAQAPDAVAAFLLGLSAVVATLPQVPLDYAALGQVALYIDPADSGMTQQDGKLECGEPWLGQF